MSGNESNLYLAEGAPEKGMRADVVFVHGLGGDYKNTWSHGDDYFPRLLQEALPHVRVWALDYPAYMTKWGGKGGNMGLYYRALDVMELMRTNHIGDLPIIFICHSLGGLLIKKILRTSLEIGSDIDDGNIFCRTRGVCFLATPHTGSTLADFVKLIDRVTIGATRYSEMMEELKAESPHLLELREWYKKKSENIKTAAFMETLPYKKVIVVNAVSSDPGVLGCTPIPLDADHNSICKPANGADSRIVQSVYRFVNESLKPNKPEKAKSIADSTGPANKSFGEYRPHHVGQECPFSKGPLAAGGTRIDTARMPNTGSLCLGREAEIALLDEAWGDDHTHVVTFVAWGGVGKSTLVNHWLNLMEKDNYRGAHKVYAWSFYSQGATEGTQVSAEQFFQETLQWFGDPAPDKGTAIEKGRRLAELVKKEPTLLLLDGLEPLQYPPPRKSDENGGQNDTPKRHGQEGALKDSGMAYFLKGLAGGGPGLCIISSRHTVADLDNRAGHAVRRVHLEHLRQDAATELLKHTGACGPSAQMAAAVKEYDGHALALALLGRYVKRSYKGDIAKRDRIPPATLLVEQGGHAWRVIAAYETLLGDSPERELLHIMGLFDRPTEAGAFAALTAEPTIDGVTGRLCGLPEEKLEQAKTTLREYGLLGEKENPGLLDCHPLVREYFDRSLEKRNPEGRQAAHGRLYHYYKETAEELPDTLVKMEPLFAAVAHGCRAGLYMEALDDVYWKRISRGEEGFLENKLGAFGSFISVMSNFFETPWSRPAGGLEEAEKVAILGWSAFALRARGRLREAREPMKASLDAAVEQEDWKNAARNAGNLSELELTLGDVSAAVQYDRDSVTHADASGDDFQMESKRTTLADALHVSGRTAEAETLFLEAEEKQKKRQPGYPYLYSLQGFQFCDLLLAKGESAAVLQRAEKFFEWRVPSDSLLDISLDNLIAGRAHLQQARQREKENKDAGGDFKQARHFLDRAVAGLRDAERNDYLPRALLARAEYYRLTKNYAKARNDLQEAREIAEYGEMKRFLNECKRQEKEIEKIKEKEKR
ncbi:MAG: alpha/beta fold hydrolase [bacterium]|nr:alpha/beta fold hydrolase [bacterium]